MKTFLTNGKYLVALLMMLLLSNCTKQVFEVDISGKTLTVLAPANNLSTTNSSVTFWWEKIEEDNVYYRIQIVDSSFTSVQEIVADTSTTSDKFTISLSPGKYQWRIQAYNSGSETPYQTFDLTIQSSPDLSGQTVTLLSPVNGLITNTATQVYQWDTLSNTDGYRFQVVNSSSTTISDYFLTTDSFSLTLAEGVYTWKVRAENSFSNSPYTTRTITIDLTAPTTPVPVTPADADTSSNPASITWTRDASAVGDSVFIANDTLFTNPAISPFYTIGTSYNFTGATGQKYFWRIKSGDAAGNWSGYSATRKFYVQ
jgi:hypothetical protein